MPAHERNKLCMVWAAAGQNHVTSECGAREMSHIVYVCVTTCSSAAMSECCFRKVCFW